jgi:hypothetical protein
MKRDGIDVGSDTCISMIYGSFYIDSFTYAVIYLLPIKFSAYLFYCMFLFMYSLFFAQCFKD